MSIFASSAWMRLPRIGLFFASVIIVNIAVWMVYIRMHRASGLDLLRVEQFEPGDGSVEANSRPQLTWHFNLEIANRGGNLLPIRITPALPGKFYWEDQRTLHFTPTDPLPVASKWDLVLSRGGISSVEGCRLANDDRRTCQTSALQWLSVRQKNFADQNITTQLVLYRAGGSSNSEGSNVTLSFNGAVNWVNLQKVLSITPPVMGLRYRQAGESEIILDGGFQPAKRYALKLASAPESKDAADYPRPETRTVFIPDVQPQLEFDSSEGYLGAAGSRTAYASAVNVPSVDVKVYRLYDNNLVPWGNDLEERTSVEEQGRLLASRTIALKNKKNVREEVPLRLDDLLAPEDRGDGIFEIQLSKTPQAHPQRVLQLNRNEEADEMDPGSLSSSMILSLSDIGLSVKQGRGGQGRQGKIPQNAPTGAWDVRVQLPNNDSLVDAAELSRADIQIEDFMPDRLKVDFKLGNGVSNNAAAEAEVPHVAAGGTLKASIHAAYFFGQSGANLHADLTVIAKPAVFAPPNWNGWIFSDEANVSGTAPVSSMNKQLPDIQLTLNERGSAQFPIDLRSLLGSDAAVDDNATDEEAANARRYQGPWQVLAETSVHDISGRAVSRDAEAFVDPGQDYIALRPGPSTALPGIATPFDVALAVHFPNGGMG